MLRKRIIFTLIYSQGSFMQSRNFRLQKVGDIRWLEKNYKFQSISFSLDELIILNASRDKKSISEFSNIVSQVVDNVFIPVAAGGGIKTIDDAKILFNSGADKIVLNTLLVEDREVVKGLVKKFGSQSVVASVDYKIEGNVHVVYINNGTNKLDIDLFEYLKYIESLGIGEIYLNSIDKDGTGFGYDLELISKKENISNIPLIIAGGAGNEQHLLKGLENLNVSAVATANLFNFIGNGLPNARKYLLDNNQNLAIYN